MSVSDALSKWLESIPGVICYLDNMKIYAPTNYGKAEDAVNRLITTVNKLFGGSTVYDAEGCWVNEKGETECEPVKVIEAAHPCISREQAKELAEALVRYAQEAEQYAVAVRNGKFYIVKTEEMVPAFYRTFGR